MSPDTRSAVLDIADQVTDEPTPGIAALLTVMNQIDLQSGDRLFSAESANTDEYFVLSGMLRLFVISDLGDEMTLEFASGPGIVVPNIARTIEGVSIVTAEALRNTRVVSFANADLVNCMLVDADVRKWGDRVLQSELVRRARREWSLATLNARDRLTQLRLLHPDLEESVPHSMIASYLGITPVTLSRIRNEYKA